MWRFLWEICCLWLPLCRIIPLFSGFSRAFLCICSTGCGGSLQYIDLLYQQNGTIYSPNYPSTYGTSEDCHWRIHAYTGYRERKVLLYFSSFDLDAHCCSCGYLEIFDGPSENFKLLTRVCGDSLPPPVISSNDYIYLKFRSNSSVRQGRSRFVAHYRELYHYKGG